MEVRTGGAAVITLRGTPIASKAHGSAVLRLHVALRFTDAAVPQSSTNATAADIRVEIVGTQPAVVFYDATSGPHASPNTLSLVKPEGRAELHLLGQQLLLSDGTDAQLSCGTGTPVAWNAPSSLTTLELGMLEGASPGHIVLESAHDGERISLSVDSAASTLTVGGATRLMVGGVDVREGLRSC